MFPIFYGFLRNVPSLRNHSLSVEVRQHNVVQKQTSDTKEPLYIETDLINALLGNSSLNIVQHATIDKVVFLRRPRRTEVEQRTYGTVSEQRFGKQTSA
jgi:hypothetical protein